MKRIAAFLGSSIIMALITTGCGVDPEKFGEKSHSSRILTQASDGATEVQYDAGTELEIASSHREIRLRLGDVPSNGSAKAQWRFDVISDQVLSNIRKSTLDKGDSAQLSQDQKTIHFAATTTSGRDGLKFQAPAGARLRLFGKVFEVKNPQNESVIGSELNTHVVGAGKALYIKPLAGKVELLLGAPDVARPKEFQRLTLSKPKEVVLQASVAIASGTTGEPGYQMIITNPNNASVDVDFALADAKAPFELSGFSQSCLNTKKIAAKGACYVLIKFKKSDAGTFSTDLRINSSFSDYQSNVMGFPNRDSKTVTLIGIRK